MKHTKSIALLLAACLGLVLTTGCRNTSGGPSHPESQTEHPTVLGNERD